MTGSPSRWRALGLDLVALCLGLLPRAAFFSPRVDSWDSVDFALGLARFDLLAYRPHFPGYPVLMALGWLGRSLGLSDAVALALPGVLFFSLSLVLVRRAVAHAAGAWAGLSAAALLSCWPGLLLVTLRPLSEGLGLALLLSAYCLAWNPSPPKAPRLALGAGFLLSLALGTRLSYLFAALPLVWISSRKPLHRKPFWLGLVAGGLLWLVPLLWLTGPGAFLDEALRFTEGHFTRWGGAVGAETSSGSRLAALCFGLWAYQLGGLWPPDGLSWTRVLASLSVLALFGFGLRALVQRRMVGRALLLALPYGVWVCLAQNPESPRHWAPLLLGFSVVGALGLPRLGLVLALSLALVSFPLAREQAQNPGPQAALAHVLGGIAGPLRFYGWKTTRLLHYYAPQHQARLAFSHADMLRDMQRDPAPGPVFFESMLRQRRRRDRCFQVVATFHQNRFVEPSYHKLALFRDCGPSAPSESSETSEHP
jgi:hypothetical protein